jgi:hypothetical protein
MTFQATMRANIEDIRSKVADFMLDICTIRRKIGEEVINGEIIPVYTDTPDIKCRLIIRSGSETTNIAAQERLTAQAQFTGTYRIQLPYGTAISEDDRILFTDTVLNTIRTFEVIFAPPFHTMIGAFVITVREVK